MNKTFWIAVVCALAIVIGMMIFFDGSTGDSTYDSGLDGGNVELKDGIQYVAIEASGGYYPRSSSAQAGIPTKLVVRTNGTYDCSAALVVRSVGFRKILPPTGEEIIDLGIPEKGRMQGFCSMGMYSFEVNFK